MNFFPSPCGEISSLIERSKDVESGYRICRDCVRAVGDSKKLVYVQRYTVFYPSPSGCLLWNIGASGRYSSYEGEIEEEFRRKSPGFRTLLREILQQNRS